MCIVNIQVDEAVLRDKMPELDSTAAIRLWVQQLVDIRIHQMELEDEETMSVEEAREMTLKSRNVVPGISQPFTATCQRSINIHIP